MLIVAFRQAFYSVRRVKLDEAMHDMGITLELIKLTKMTMRFTRTIIKYENVLNESFAFNTRVKQGDELSATLFITALHYAIKDIDQRGTILDKM